jgi:hypothetical protein
MYQILEGRNRRMEFLDSRPPRLADLVRDALAVDPTNRCASAGAMRLRLSALREGDAGAVELARWVEIAVAHRLAPQRAALQPTRPLTSPATRR